jgi:hypothetical protein
MVFIVSSGGLAQLCRWLGPELAIPAQNGTDVPEVKYKIKFPFLAPLCNLA